MIATTDLCGLSIFFSPVIVADSVFCPRNKKIIVVEAFDVLKYFFPKEKSAKVETRIVYLS